MPLLPPRAIGPLSECSTKVRVQGQIAGANIEVIEVGSGNIVASATASSPDQVFTLTASIPAGARIAARQMLGMDSSELTPGPEQVEVQKKPSTVGGVSFPTPLFECGKCIWIEGLVPGATVELRDGPTLLGTGESYSGVARFGVTPLPAGADIKAQQNACGEPGTVTDGPAVEQPIPGKEQGRILPAPEIEEPLKRCESRALVKGVYPGATVRLMRSAGPDHQACFDRAALWFGVNPHFSEGETVRAEQSFQECEWFSLASDPVTVGPLEPIALPGLKGPLCAGATTVTVTNLRYGARVYITVVNSGHHGDAPPVGGTVYEGTAPDDGTFDFPIPPLPTGVVVYVQQELCGVKSEVSNMVHVTEAPEALDKPVIPEPVFECATVVHVENLTPGTRVEVYSQDVNAPIGMAQVYEEEADIAVAPMLQAGDIIWAIAKGCGHTSSESDKVEVKELEALNPPVVKEPVYACYVFVTVTSVVPGARVDIFVNGAWRGSKVSGSDEAEVPIMIGALEKGDLVTARQLLCGRTSEMSQGVRVQEFIGRWYRVGGQKQAEILAVHAALLPSNKILYFGGDQHNASAANPNPDIDHTRLFSCDPPHNITRITGLPDNADLFCSGHALLPDGQLLAAGGTLRWAFPDSRDEEDNLVHFHGGHFPGVRESYRFEFLPAGSEQWEATATKLVTARAGDVIPGGDLENTGGRWYPTLLTLPDGRVLAMGGHPLPDDRRHTTTSLEIYDPVTDSWSIVGSSDYNNIPGAYEVPGRGRHSEYPRLFVLPDGSVLSLSTMEDGNIEKWNVGTDAADWTYVIGPPPSSGDPNDFYRGNPQPSTPVLLPLLYEQNYHAKVLLCGAKTCYTLEPLVASPSWTATSRVMNDYPGPGIHNPNRKYMNATLLPSGEVLASGGTDDGKDSTGIKKAELYNPFTNTWSVLPEAETVRNYHSVALLMPSGAVWHAGSNIDANQGGENVRNLTIEIFEPWYFCENRPRISGVTQRACHGGRLSIRTPDASKISRVALVRCGSATHAFNPDQRYVTVSFRHSEWDLLTAFLPDDPAVLVPGYYLCFILTENNVPSEGKFVQICLNTTSRPGFVIDWPRFNWWNRIDWRIRDYLRLDLIGAERLKELLRHTFEEHSEDEDASSDARSKDKLEKLEELTKALSVRIRRLEKELREAEGNKDQEKKDKGKKDDDHKKGGGHHHS